MTEGQAYADAVAQTASNALSRRTTRTGVFSIGSLAFRLNGPADDPVDWMGRALLPAAPTANHDALHKITVWDGSDPQCQLPPAQWDTTSTQRLGAYATHSTDAIRCAIEFETMSVVVSDFQRGHTHTWYPDLTALPHWAKAAPFRIPLSWLCNRNRMQLVHGAAVGIDGRAVLLAGKGGSGKSTTALACALAGFEYLGDDFCAVEPAAGTVHMVYRTAKMSGATLKLLPKMRERLENPDRIESEKGVVFFDSADVILKQSAQLSAIILPRVGDASQMIYPASREETLRALLPSTVLELLGGTAATPRFLMELVRCVPAYHLVLRQDVPAVVASVAACMGKA